MPILRPSEIHQGLAIHCLQPRRNKPLGFANLLAKAGSSRLVVVTQCPKRDIGGGLCGDKSGLPWGLAISMLVCVFRPGLNGEDNSQGPGLFLSREVFLFQLLMLPPDLYIHAYI